MIMTMLAGSAMAALGERLLQFHLPRTEAAHAGDSNTKNANTKTKNTNTNTNTTSPTRSRSSNMIWTIRMVIVSFELQMMGTLSPFDNLQVLNHTFTCFYPGQEIEVKSSRFWLKLKQEKEILTCFQSLPKRNQSFWVICF